MSQSSIYISALMPSELMSMAGWSEILESEFGNLIPRYAGRLKSNVYSRFDSGVSPDGYTWEPLSEQTYERKRGGRMLVETGRMRGSFNFYVSSDEISVTNTDFKADFHDSGTSRTPSRPFIGFSDSDIEEIEQIVDRIVNRIISKF